MHRIVIVLRTFIKAVRHVATGGRTTRTAAVRRATRPPDRCPRCHQTVPHSPDWRDHIHH